MAVTATGDRLAWATGDAVEIYDPATGGARELPLDGATRVGGFSADGSMLAVHADGLQVLDVASGEVVAAVEGSPRVATLLAAWRPDGSALDYVDGDDLVTVPVDGSRPTQQPTTLTSSASLAWAPDGESLVALQDVAGNTRLLRAPVTGSGRVGPPERIDTTGIALDRLLGFSGRETVAVSAFLLESGPVERVLDVSIDGGSPADITILPSQGDNWVSTRTLAVSADALRAGSTDFDNQLWPWSHRARLAGCILIGLFGLGLWLTRRPRAARRR